MYLPNLMIAFSVFVALGFDVILAGIKTTINFKLPNQGNKKDRNPDSKEYWLEWIERRHKR